MDYISGVAGGGVGTRAPGRRPWVGSTYFIQPFINAFLSRNLDQNTLKLVYF